MAYADIRVLGGLPITVKYSVQGPDRSVGIFHSYVEEFTIVKIGNRKVTKPSHSEWIENKLNHDEVCQAIAEEEGIY